ncbi:hypothetical protein BN1723_000916 [Verticillium longisporum]|uniref:Protein kinase domain-containing protein n=2 Tax=Verticillium longisporum TaxID=100787 RepID=A0A0G4ND39_VERLO|nr:hypothetical protein BN1723_000916 [Verticillium longisporum]
MEGLVARENFKLVDGKLVIVYCAVVFRRDGCLYKATSPYRQVAPSSIQDLQNITPIAPEDYQPLLPSDAFIAHDPALYYRRAGTARYLDSIEQGLRHLHSLGFIHNDLNPANIMITEEDIPVIIDFDSATAPGASLQNVKRTHGWFDHRIVVSQQSNDLDALAEIRTWLTGSSPYEYRFDL